MWVCNQCYQENNEQDAICRSCGTQRSAGRFQTHAHRPAQRAIDATRPPQPVVAQAQPVAETAPRRPRADGYTPPPLNLQKAARSSLERLSLVFGFILSILLPLLTAALAWRQYDVLRQALIPLLLPESAADIVKIILYTALSLIAVLLSALPGLWTLLASRPSLSRGIRHTATRK